VSSVSLVGAASPRGTDDQPLHLSSAIAHSSRDEAQLRKTRSLAVKIGFAEQTPLRLGTTVELRIATTPPRGPR